MTSSIQHTVGLDDEQLAAVVHLTGPGAVPMLGAAVAAMGGSPGAVRIEQVSHEPGRRCTVAYRMEVDWGTAVSSELMVATTSVEGPPPGAAVLEADGLTVGLWRYPFDPELPALVDAVSPERLGHLLAPHLAGPHHLSVLTYRPGRRAVVRVRSGRGELYLKILRPSRAARLVRVHERLRSAGVAVPEVLEADLAAGVVVLGRLGGSDDVVLRSVLTGPASSVGVEPAPVHALGPTLDAIAACHIDHRPARRQPLRDAGAHLCVLDAVLPDDRARLGDLRERLRIDDPGNDEGIGAGVTVHGDLHDGQIVVDGSGVPVGLLDLDDVGSGTRADDLGNLMGHALTLASVTADDRTVRRWAAGVPDLAERTGLDPDQVVRRAAAAMVSLATGPFRVREDDWQERTSDRLDVADALLDGGLDGLVRRVSDHRHDGLMPVGDK